MRCFDPLITKQALRAIFIFLLQSQGLPVTWNNPDIWIARADNPGNIEPDSYHLTDNTDYIVTVRVHNAPTLFKRITDNMFLQNPTEKRKIPLDKTIKIALRVTHNLSSSLFLGAVYYDIKTLPELHLAIAISGALLIAREIYKGGLWIVQIRSLFIWSKILILLWVISTKHLTIVPILAISILGIFSSHITKKIRKRKFIPPYTYT